MMEIDDDDLELESDPMKDFLKAKLQNMKELRTELENTLKNRAETLQKYRRDLNMESGETAGIKIEQVWNRIVRNRLVIGFKITKSEPSEDLPLLTDLDVYLTWTSSLPLTYRVHLVTGGNERQKAREGLPGKLFTDRLDLDDDQSGPGGGQIVIVLDRTPPFVDRSPHKISGIITFNLEAEHGESNVRMRRTLQVPPVILSPGDVFRMTFGNGSRNSDWIDFLCGFCTLPETAEFLVVGCEHGAVRTRDLEQTLETKCFLTRISHDFLPNVSMFAPGEGKQNFELLIETIRDDRLRVFYRTESTLSAFFHHINSLDLSFRLVQGEKCTPSERSS